MSSVSRAFRALVVLGLVLQVVAFSPISIYAAAPADPAFQRTWERTDKPVDDLVVNRTWIWGPEPFTGGLIEPYVEGDDAARLVQYYDKSRMEITDPNAVDDGLWYVTNGLLVNELITGELQLGHNDFLQLAPAQVPVAGDPNDPDGPTYATFLPRLDDAPTSAGSVLSLRIDRGSNVTDDPELAAHGVTVAQVDEVTRHAIADPFWAFMTSAGQVMIDGQQVEAPLFESAYYATGRPITEPYWVTVRVAGTLMDVLLQCFERRCLTYTPSNPAGWQTEMGNVGRHYDAWRNGGGQVYDIGSVTPAAGGDAGIDGGSVSIDGGNVADDGVVSIVPADAPQPNDGDVPVSGAYDIRLHGTELTGTATLTFAFDPGLVPDGVDSSQLVVAFWDEATGQWQSMPADVDASASTATVQTDHLSIWRVFSQADTGSEPNENVRPSLDLNGAASGTGTTTILAAGDGPASLASAVTITDPDDTMLESASLTLTSHPDGASELLVVDISGTAISATFAPATGELTLSGTAPIADYIAVLSTATYQNTAADPTNGTRSIRVSVNDGEADSNVAVAQVRIGESNTVPVPGNTPPVAIGQSVTVVEDGSVQITLSGTDADGDELTFSVLSQPQRGTLSGTAPNLTYTPDPDFDGSDSFTFQVDDGSATSNIATVSVTVAPVNDTPIATGQLVTTPEDTAVDITLLANDTDGDSLNWTIVQPPIFGTLSGSGPTLTYMPGSNFASVDVFTFVVNDGQVDSNVATVSISVESTNDGPVAANQSVEVDEDSSVAITLQASDLDADPLTYSVINGPTHGTLAGTAPNLTYIPDANANGPDEFTFQASDGNEMSNIATVSITVHAVNDAPTADDQTVSTDEESPVIITLTGFDIDDDDLTFDIVTGPAHGSAVLTGSEVTYTPEADYTGADSFTFVANDDQIDSNVATISITVNGVNDKPIVTLSASVATYDEGDTGVTVDGDVSVTDIDSVNLSGATIVLTNSLDGAAAANESISIDTTGTGIIASGDGTHSITLSGTATVNEYQQVLRSLTYTNLDQDPNQTSRMITIVVSDGTASSDIVTKSVAVVQVNDAPVINDQIFSIDENRPNGTIVGTVVASDVEDGQTHTYAITSGNTDGAFTIDTATGQLTVANAAALDHETTPAFSLTVSVTDNGTNPANLSDDATITVTVNDWNEAPIVTSGYFSIAENSPNGSFVADIDVSDVDQGQTHVFSFVSGDPSGAFAIDPVTGVITVADTTQIDFENVDTFNLMVQAIDNGNPPFIGAATVTAAIIDANDAPVVDDQTLTAYVGSPNGTAVGTVVATDEDTPPQTLTYLITAGNSTGTFAIDSATGQITVVDTSDLDPATTPSYSLTISVTDNGAGFLSDTATITINVSYPNQPPVLDLNGAAPGTSYSSVFITGWVEVASVDSTIVDSDSPDFDGGMLIVEVTGNGDPGDRITVEDSNSAASGVDVIFNGAGPRTLMVGGIAIGTDPNTATGASGTPKVFTLNANATPERVAVLIGSLRFLTEEGLITSDRTITVSLVDGDGTDGPGADDTGTATSTVLAPSP